MKFKTGDLVHVYGFDSVNAMTILRRKIVGIDTDGSLETDAGEFVHPKQCRLLKKKERRRIWVNPTLIQEARSGANIHTVGLSEYNRSHLGWIEFVEVKKK